MTAVASFAPAVVEYDPLRDKTYRRAKLGPDVAAFLAWLELGGASPITVDNYERALAVCCRMYPATPVHEITDGQLAQVFKTFPARSRRVRVAPYRTFFKWARQTRRVHDNPMELLPLIRKQPRRKPEVFTAAEVETLLTLDVRDAAPLALLFDGALRRHEAIEMQLRRCQPDSHYIKVVDGKGGKDRRIPMRSWADPAAEPSRLQRLLADLELLYGLGPKDHILYKVYANGQGARRIVHGRVGEGTFARWWRRCLDDAGVRYRNPHTARHTYATQWRRQGATSDDLAVTMGHESVRTTIDLYEQIEVEDVDRRMALLGD